MIGAIIGGLFSVGSAIYGSVKKKQQRQSELKKIEAQRQNLKAINEYKNKMFDYQNQSIMNQFEQGQKALNMSTAVTKANQGIGLRQSAESNWMQTQQFNRQARNTAQQATDAVGAVTQQSSLSGFRNSGSAQNLVAKQTEAGNEAKNALQEQINFTRYQSLANTANAYSQSNIQLAQYAMEKDAQEQNKNLAIAQLDEQRKFENDQYLAQDKQLADTGTYLGDDSNFWADDFMNIAGATLNAGLQFGGAYQQEQAVKDQMAFAEQQAEDQRNWQAQQTIRDRVFQKDMADNALSNQMTILDKQNAMAEQQALYSYQLQNDPLFLAEQMKKYNLKSVR